MPHPLANALRCEILMWLAHRLGEVGRDFILTSNGLFGNDRSLSLVCEIGKSGILFDVA